jgi:nucleotide-binding universal stress UspA family protein
MTEPAAPASRQIVVGVDESEPAKLALRWAQHLGALAGAGIIAVNAWEQPPPYISPMVDNDWDGDTAAQQMVEKVLADTFSTVPLGGVRIVTRQGHPASVLIKESEQAYVLVVGRSGRHGFAGTHLGSVSARCAEYAKCPVLVVHDPPPNA